MIIPKKELLTQMQWANRFIDKQSTIPILKNVLFECSGSRLTLTATDLEIAGSVITAGRGERGEQWSTAAPVKKLIEYLQKVDEEEISLCGLDNHWLALHHGNSVTRVAGMGKDSYPALPEMPAPVAVLSHFPLAVKRTAFAITNALSRYSINGALLLVKDGVARLITTDGHRLSLAPLQVPRNTEDIRVLIPKRALLEAARLEDGFSFAMNEDHLFFNWGKTTIIARKGTGNFPDHNRAIPSQMPNHVMLPVKTAERVIDRVAVYADARSRAVRLQVVDEKTVRVFASSVEDGEAEGVIPVRPGEIANVPYEIGFNADYLTDFLRLTDVQSVGFCWGAEPKSPAMLVTGDWQYVVMPMRI